MSESNRTLNRIILLLLGLIALAIAVVAAWPVVTGAPLPLVHQTGDAVRALALPGSTLAWIVAGLLAVAIIVAVTWILTRRRAHSRAAIDAGGVVIDAAVVEGVLRTALTSAPDVVGVSASSHLRRGRTGPNSAAPRLLRLRVQLRPRADLTTALDQVKDAVATADRLLGTSLPTVVHLTTGVHTFFARDRRVD